MRLNDAVVGLVLIIFSVAEIAYTRTFPKLYGQQFGPDLFPIVIGVGLLGCGIVLTAKGLAERRAVPWLVLGDWARDRASVVNFGLVIAGLIFYIAASDTLGFIPCALIILVTLFLRFGVGLGASLFAAVTATLAIHEVFAGILLVPLPWGLLQPIAWRLWTV